MSEGVEYEECHVVGLSPGMIEMVDSEATQTRAAKTETEMTNHLAMLMMRMTKKKTKRRKMRSRWQREVAEKRQEQRWQVAGRKVKRRRK